MVACLHVTIVSVTDEIKVVATNRKAGFEYFLLETFEAGLALKGSEIKSIRAGQMSLVESYVDIEANEAWLRGAHIAPYEQASRYNHDPLRPRRLHGDLALQPFGNAGHPREREVVLRHLRAELGAGRFHERLGVGVLETADEQTEKAAEQTADAGKHC